MPTRDLIEVVHTRGDDVGGASIDLVDSIHSRVLRGYTGTRVRRVLVPDKMGDSIKRIPPRFLVRQPSGLDDNLPVIVRPEDDLAVVFDMLRRRYGVH